MAPITTSKMSEKKTTKSGKAAKSQEVVTEKVPDYDPDIPEPTSRAELLKYWINLSLDAKTANRMLWISEDGSKVVRRGDDTLCPVLDTPKRYEYSPQVVAKEGIWGFRAYWEIEYTGWVVIGTTYEGAGRRASAGMPSGLGENEESWSLGWSGSCYQVWFNARCKQIQNFPQCFTFGVYVDQPAGIMNFYLVEEGEDGKEKEVRLIQRFDNPIKDKILPGFWLGGNSSCTILKKPE
ncbi:hypothetical protein UPYG_G00140650 [Umbra pygmaea]|uniref:B30.2/SPRY domain-containing protein n=1 Tax=Umbra pygmaea TaxID=75934 RepID=A0ABD0WV87_UMBPY